MRIVIVLKGTLRVHALNYVTSSLVILTQCCSSTIAKRSRLFWLGASRPLLALIYSMSSSDKEEEEEEEWFSSIVPVMLLVTHRV